MGSKFTPFMSFQRIVIEACFLIVAVLLALAVDEAWQDYENNEAAVQALSRIHQELDKNRTLIIDENDQRKLELERIQKLIVQIDSESPAAEDYDNNVKISISILRDTAWRSAQFADVLKFVPYEQIERVTAVYSLQELYERQTSRAFNFQGNVKFIEATTVVQLRASYDVLNNLFSLEQALLSAYEQARTQTESVK